MSNIIETNDSDFKKEVLESDLPVLVDFWAPWCGPCRMVAPIVEEISKEFEGKVKVCKLNTDENPTIPTEFEIRSIPTLMIFEGGDLKSRIVGFRPKSDLKKRLEEAIGPSA